MMYAEGKGVAKDDTLAIAWWRKAAAQGQPNAQKSLAYRGLKW
jgi:TPR repeat protein